MLLLHGSYSSYELSNLCLDAILFYLSSSSQWDSSLIAHSLYHLMDMLARISIARISVVPAFQEHSPSPGSEEHHNRMAMWWTSACFTPEAARRWEARKGFLRGCPHLRIRRAWGSAWCVESLMNCRAANELNDFLVVLTFPLVKSFLLIWEPTDTLMLFFFVMPSEWIPEGYYL